MSCWFQFTQRQASPEGTPNITLNTPSPRTPPVWLSIQIRPSTEMSAQPKFPPVWQDPRGSAAGGSLMKPLFLLDFQKLNTSKDSSSQNWLFSQACPRFIETNTTTQQRQASPEGTRGAWAVRSTLQRYLAHKKTPTPIGPP